MKKFNASNASFEHRIDLLDVIFNNMQERVTSPTGTSGVLLAGDPGTGKTSFMRFFAKLTGLKLITIEAPHITEEHIINIPFIVYDPKTNQTKDGETHATGDAYKIVLSDSNLFSQIKTTRAMTDVQYKAQIRSATADVKKIYEKLGGDDDTIPQEIADIREKYTCVLFLDEYFRQTSTRIRNMLRGILNGRLGAHNIPAHCYIIYASNLTDEGVEGIPLNNDFQMVDFQTPDKEEWFHYLTSKFENDEHVKLNPKLVDTFYNILEQEDLSHNDMDAEVRSSPRRWEQLMLYINSSLPVKDKDEAVNLMTNVKLNFRNYLSGRHSELASKVLDAVAKLIDETSGISVSASASNSAADWRNTLAHQIEQKMKLGEHRKYVPVISGPPGVGKTTKMMQLATDENLRYIYIDCSTLDPEDVHGIALANKRGDNITTTFSMPKLYKQIMDDIKAADAEYLTSLKKSGDKAAAAEYKTARWKYLIFFDELNRTSAKVFNGIRRAILEKDFGDDNKLPEESIVVAAINPSDIGATDLTSHMRDVLDIIDTKPSWTSTKRYLESVNFENLRNDKIPEVSLNLLMAFVDKFKVSNTHADEAPFYLNIGESPVYVSPREYVNMYKTLVRNFDSKAYRLTKDIDLDSLSGDQLFEMEKKVRDAIANAFSLTLKNVFVKHNTGGEAFLHDLAAWLHSSDVNIGEGIFFKRASGVKNTTHDFIEMMNKYYNDASMDLADDIEFVNYLNTVDPHKFKDDVALFIHSKILDAEHVKDFLTTKNYNLKELKDDKIKITSTKITKLEHIVLEMIHAIKIHHLSNSVMQMIRHTFDPDHSSALEPITREGENEYIDDDTFMEFLQTASRIDSYFTK